MSQSLWGHSVVLWRLWLSVELEQARDKVSRSPIEVFWTAKKDTKGDIVWKGQVQKSRDREVLRPRPNILETRSESYFGTENFPGPIFFNTKLVETGSETFFGPYFFEAGSDTIKMKNSQGRILPGPGRRTLI